MKMETVMSHDFSKVAKANIQRSSFNRSHGYKTTFDAGLLIPIYADEVLPGDTFNLSLRAFARLATPINPFMDNVYMETFFFFVPLRLIWDNFQKFMGEQLNPGDSIDFLVPQITTPIAGFVNGTLFDYLGLPTGIAGMEDINALHSRAYNLIYREWFRDQNMINSPVLDTGDGPDNPADYVLRKRGKRHDYFTSCLPTPQKGTAVSIPLGTSAPITGIGAQDQVYVGDNMYETDATGLRAITGTINLVAEEDASNTGFPDIRANLTGATAANVNQLREAFQIQKLLERDMRGGTRYTEIIRSHFGVTSPDARLQRPEYLGGGSSQLMVQQVEQTSSTDGTSPQGNLTGFGTIMVQKHGFIKSFTEHGVIIGMACIRADLTYQQGIDRMWSRQSRFEFYWPELSNIGEQAVLSKEIFVDGTSNDDLVFGYQERFAEYRYKNSKITGQFRSNFAQTLDSWHLSQNFASRPTLNQTFIEETPPIDRVIAIPSFPHFIYDSKISLKCARPMPTYATPGLDPHF